MSFGRLAGLKGQDMSPAQPVVHLELHTGDLRAAREYYAALCGWPQERIESTHGSYLAMDLNSELGGGIVECAAPRALWLPYVEVPCVDKATEHAQELGATVLLGPREGPAGWRSVITTPVGGELAFWHQKR